MKEIKTIFQVVVNGRVEFVMDSQCSQDNYYRLNQVFTRTRIFKSHYKLKDFDEIIIHCTVVNWKDHHATEHRYHASIAGISDLTKMLLEEGALSNEENTTRIGVLGMQSDERMKVMNQYVNQIGTDPFHTHICRPYGSKLSQIGVYCQEHNFKYHVIQDDPKSYINRLNPNFFKNRYLKVIEQSNIVFLMYKEVPKIIERYLRENNIPFLIIP